LIEAVHFLDALGGTGKKFLISLLLARIRSQNEVALALASSGIAATLFEDGRTAHSNLKFATEYANQRITSLQLRQKQRNNNNNKTTFIYRSFVIFHLKCALLY